MRRLPEDVVGLSLLVGVVSLICFWNFLADAFCFFSQQGVVFFVASLSTYESILSTSTNGNEGTTGTRQ